MKIKIVQPVMAAGKMFLKDKVIAIADAVANDLVERGLAVPVKDSDPAAPVAK